VNVRTVEAGVQKNVRNEHFQSTHLRPASNSTARARVNSATLGLLLSLARTRVPERLDRGNESLVEIRNHAAVGSSVMP